MIGLNLSAGLLLLLSLLLGCSIGTVEREGMKDVKHPVQKTQSYKQLNRYQQDFVFLTAILEEAYPYFEQAWTQDGYEQTKQQILKRLADIQDPEEFKLTLQRFLATLKNSHTQVKNWRPSESSSFPYQLNCIGDTMIIWKVDESLDRSLIGCEVISLNGLPIQELVERINSYISGENKYDTYLRIAWVLSFPNFLRRLGIIDTFQISLSYRTREGSVAEIVVMPVASSDSEWQGPKRYPVTLPRDSAFCYQILPEHNLAYFQFNSLLDKKAMFEGIHEYVKPIFRPFARWFLNREFKKAKEGKKTKYVKPGQESLQAFLSEMFKDIEERGINNLVVDLRYNSGGDYTLSKQFLYWFNIEEVRDITYQIKISDFFRQQFERIYTKLDKAYQKVHGTPLPQEIVINQDSLLIAAGEKSADFFAEVKDRNSPYYMAEPSKRFSGKIYVLIGPGTESAGSSLATVMKDNGIGAFVGLPTANRPSGATTLSRFRLPNTKTQVSISTMYQLRPDTSRHNEDGLYPHILISKSIDDVLNGKDPAFEWILDDINRDNR
jgi:hypothetical protein